MWKAEWSSGLRWIVIGNRDRSGIMYCKPLCIECLIFASGTLCTRAYDTLYQCQAVRNGGTA